MLVSAAYKASSGYCQNHLCEKNEHGLISTAQNEMSWNFISFPTLFLYKDKNKIEIVF